MEPNRSDVLGVAVAQACALKLLRIISVFFVQRGRPLVAAVDRRGGAARFTMLEVAVEPPSSIVISAEQTGLVIVI